MKITFSWKEFEEAAIENLSEQIAEKSGFTLPNKPKYLMNTDDVIHLPDNIEFEMEDR